MSFRFSAKKRQQKARLEKKKKLVTRKILKRVVPVESFQNDFEEEEEEIEEEQEEEEDGDHINSEKALKNKRKQQEMEDGFESDFEEESEEDDDDDDDGSEEGGEEQALFDDFSSDEDETKMSAERKERLLQNKAKFEAAQKDVPPSRIIDTLNEEMKCSLCKKKFEDAGALLAHYERIHSFVCPKCNRSYLTEYKYKKHYVVEHLLEVVPVFRKIDGLTAAAIIKAKEKHLPRWERVMAKHEPHWRGGGKKRGTVKWVQRDNKRTDGTNEDGKKPPVSGFKRKGVYDGYKHSTSAFPGSAESEIPAAKRRKGNGPLDLGGARYDYVE